MKIAVFCSNYPPHLGGLEVAASNIATGLAARHSVTVVTTAWDGQIGRVQEGRVTVYRLPAAHVTEQWGVPYPVPTGPGMRVALNAVKEATVLHAHGALYATSMLAAMIARRSGKPLVVTEHVGFVNYRRGSLNQLQRTAWSTVGRFVLGAACDVTVYNERVQHWMTTRMPADRVHFIPNGVDVERFVPATSEDRNGLRARFGLPAQEPLLLFVGRDAEKKNLETVLRMPRPNYSVVLCGANRNIGGERIIDLGVVPYSRMPDLFRAVDVMVQPSSGEGFPLAVQEGMAAALPVILLWDQGYARMVDREVVVGCDSAETIEPAVTQLMADPARRRRIGSLARDWAVAQWSWNATIAQYEAVMIRAEQRSSSMFSPERSA